MTDSGTLAQGQKARSLSRGRSSVPPLPWLRGAAAISVPDDTFEAATKRAQKLGMSRSEFFSLAARRYLDELDRESVTEQVDEALAAARGDESAAAAVAAGRRRLSTGEEW